MSTRKAGAILRRDHARPRNQPAAIDPIIADHLTQLVQPATYAVMEQYRRLGLRERVLTLPVMVSLVLTLIWRQVPAVSDLVRLAARQRLLWTPPFTVSQQAFSLRLRCMPASLLASVAQQVFGQLATRAAARRRPQIPVITRAHRHFAHLWIADASNLEALFKKVGALREEQGSVHGGKLLALLDLASKLPVHLVWDARTSKNERHLLERVKGRIPPSTLLLLDRGFYGFVLFDWLTDHAISFITRTRTDATYQDIQVLETSDTVRDRLIGFGVFRSNPCHHPVRLVEIKVGTTWYQYLTNVLDPAILPPQDVAALYGQRWRIEEAFALIKRLLGLSYLWTGAANGIALQLWGTVLLYAVLLDLCDQIADVRMLPLDRISVEMVYRGLYHFTVAYAAGEATDPVEYLASQDDLGIVKRLRNPRKRVDKESPILNL
ncbi:MAG: hypothetical protein NVS2B16_33210 [Chloroflexota bacterium]